MEEVLPIKNKKMEEVFDGAGVVLGQLDAHIGNKCILCFPCPSLSRQLGNEYLRLCPLLSGIVSFISML